MPSKSELQHDSDWDKRLKHYGRAVIRWTRHTEQVMEDETMIREIRVKTPMETGGEYLVIIKATNQGQKLIAFHGADTLEDGLAGALKKLEGHGLTWKEDLPYKGKRE